MQVKRADEKGGGGAGVQVILERAGLQLEQAIGAVLYGTDDAREGIAAFVAKRKPRFGGH